MSHFAVASIAVLDDYQQTARSFADWASLAPRAQAVFFHDHVADPDSLAARLAPFDVVVLMRERTRLDAGLLARLPRLKLIVTVGMWNAAIDLLAAREQRIVVSGTTGGDAAATPALTWALILAVTRNLHAEATSLRAGGWQVGLGVDVNGKTLGLLGLGRIGQAVARLGQAFGMRTIAWSQNLTAERAAEHGVERVDKDQLFRDADVLSVHLKLGERTCGIVGERELALMKPSAYLVNTSRGPIVSEAALIAALQARSIAGAALDVFDEEPLAPQHPYRFLPNVLATPHIGYVTENTYRTAYPQIVEGIQAWLDGAPVRELQL
ncbi:lactate dehydrogenase-like oxidoreductase [Burkholderia sp. Ch1-1]|uniref:D-3-phosphoglycerate dehydrogenase n=1 Tax=Paraburkholderia dioscoreae TaxID=2604047 RepID=A0A5Q4Z3B3_9BURK|nr:D-2-hydroxyacid dehydrogenase family protein [Paraburkholderia dioscoreae]EIF34043.1 lactate dehydrogenase-like oxidoreductase [Burkholderia sp. Ch1-1]VVD32954.1 D-3-phosphoglycerate dehydrogenase [Paraburkholderia dioscoreae]